ncbi:MAG: hypothetical protein RLO01_18750 [Thalassobaculaceae bacterium]
MAPLDPTADGAVRRGVAAQRAARHMEAGQWFRLAGCAAPGDARILPLLIAGDAAEQVRWGRRTLCVDPLLARVQEHQGSLLARSGEAGRAVAALRRALIAEPPTPHDAASLVAEHLGRAGRVSGAYPLAWWAAVCAPADPARQVRLAAVAAARGRHGMAATASIAASRLLPGVPALAAAAAGAARQSGRHAEAWARARIAALVAPEAGEVAALLCEGAERPEGLASARHWARRALVLAPLATPVWDALARAERGAGRPAASLSAARHGLIVAPGDRSCARAMAQAALQMVRFDLAGQVARAGRVAHPDDPELAYLQAQAEKAVGDLGRGWDLDALRTTGPRFHRTLGLPPKAPGPDLPAQGLLVAAEQGIGDELLFLSCLPDLLAECPAPIVEADARLHPLLARSFPGLSLIGRQVRADGRGAVYDYREIVPALGLSAHIHAGDLPGRYRRERRLRPAAGGYLKADETAVERWRSRIAARDGEGPAVGICWRSMLRSGVRSAYYAGLTEMLPILRLPGFRFVCLQYDDCAAELDALRRDHGIDLWRPEDLDQREDLDGTAALISALDTVVSTATSVCVLAAALGRPTIRLAPSFYSILDDGDLFFAELTPALRRDEPMDVSVAVSRAAALLVDRRPGPN